MITKDFLHALQLAYELPEIEAIKQIHNGTHRVYRLDWNNRLGRQHIAVKISKDCSAHSLVAKQLEQSILQSLNEKLIFTPKLLAPCNEPQGAQCFSWGLLWQQDTLVTCFQWISTNPYQYLQQQMALDQSSHAPQYLINRYWH